LDVLRSAPKLLRIVKYLLDQQIINGGERTPSLRKRDIADAVDDPPRNMAAALWDIIHYRLAIRVKSKHGRGGGTVYSVPSQIQPHVFRLSSMSSTRQTSVSVSAGPRYSEEEQLASAVEQIGLQQWGIGANDLLGIWRKKATDGNRLFTSLDELVESADRIAYYLNSPQADGIREPRRWALSQLRQGVYGRPAGYLSWRERQEKVKMESAKREAEALAKMKQERLDAEFEVWAASLPDEKAVTITNGFNPRTQIGRGLLKEAFCREKGYEDRAAQ
jgi:hypothetical protein